MLQCFCCQSCKLLSERKGKMKCFTTNLYLFSKYLSTMNQTMKMAAHMTAAMTPLVTFVYKKIFLYWYGFFICIAPYSPSSRGILCRRCPWWRWGCCCWVCVYTDHQWPSWRPLPMVYAVAGTWAGDQGTGPLASCSHGEHYLPRIINRLWLLHELAELCE